ncbi:lipopolysaccharide biosynthesis protein [Sphingobacterium multivorum]|uniref:lipopolysaccharide biosynthesis protein n=1 Tax=Sphingobacterium multivorum TaxID=28454 RepID=UPI0031B9BF09
MLGFFKGLFNKLGVDGAIGYTLISRMLQAVSGIFTLLFVVKFLSIEEQGYFYTFGSIIAIQVFFELGITGIIVQYVAHEASNFSWASKSVFQGTEQSMSRMSSLLHFSIKWFSLIAVLLFFTLVLVGIVFFTRYGDLDNTVEWKMPWVLLAFSTSVLLVLSPILAFLEGLGKVKEIARLRLIQQICQVLLTYLLFFLGYKLYAVPLASLITCVIMIGVIYCDGLRSILVYSWKKLGLDRINYKKEIFPYQWKIALSWISGYFIFQLFNPVLFATEGATVAGQMGMTLAVLNAIFSLTFSWISTKVPLFSSLIAKKEFTQLDTVFNKTLKLSALLNIFCLIIFFMLVFVLDYFKVAIAGKEFYNRFLPIVPLILMMIPIFTNHIVGAWATYLRCHKEEPMLIQSVLMGILCSISTIVLGKIFGVVGITTGYMILSIGSLIWTYITFRKLKVLWHT